MTGRIPEQTTQTAGALAGAVAHIAGGVTLSGANQVNQNNPPALGEGIEQMAFRSAGAVTVENYIGDGTGVRALGFAADFALIVPVTSTGPASVVVSAQGASGVSGEAASGFIAGANLTVPAEYNVANMHYRVLALRDTGAPVADQSIPLPTACGIVAGVEAKLSDAFALSGACTLEFWGKPRAVSGAKWFAPLLMAGNGADKAGGGYSAGIYGYAADPDGHGWSGASLRWLQSNYLARERTAPHNSINRYNLNSGVVTAVNDPVHIVLTHDGSGLWRLYLDGKLAKEHRRSMSLETSTLPGVVDGGDGVARPLYLFGAMMGSTFTGIEGEIYRARAWTQALTADHVRSILGRLKGGAAEVIPAARDVWDFRSGIPAGVTGIVAGVPGGSTPTPVSLTISPASSVAEDAAVGTLVASFTSDGTSFALSGADAARLAISGANVLTTGSIDGLTELSFSITASASGRLDTTANATVTVTEATEDPGWVYPVFTGSTMATVSATVDVQPNGDQWVVTTGNSGNGRAFITLQPDTTYELETHLEFGDATRIICRRPNLNGSNSAGTDFWAMDRGSLTRIDRTDTIVTTGAAYWMQFIGITAIGQKFIINPSTRIREAP